MVKYYKIEDNIFKVYFNSKHMYKLIINNVFVSFVATDINFDAVLNKTIEISKEEVKHILKNSNVKKI